MMPNVADNFSRNFCHPKMVVPFAWVGIMTFHDTCHDITNLMVQEIREKNPVEGHVKKHELSPVELS